MPDEPASPPEPGSLRDAWEAEAAHWIAWARTPGHDSYWHFHRDAFLAGLPEPPQRIVDVGCGEGRLVRDLKSRGYDVVGVDGSRTLLEAARAADPSGEYHLADAAELPLPDGIATLVTQFMSPQDIDDLDGAMREATRILVPGGRLRIALVHPINSAGRFASREAEAVFEIRGSYFADRRYADTFERDGLTMTFASIHRPLERVVSAIVAAGLLIDRVAEPAGPPVEEYARWRRVPLFLHVGAIKPPATPEPRA